MNTPHKAFVLLFIFLGLTACQTAYFSALEKVGIHKREILVDRVEDARDSQVDAKETFKSALDHFQTVLNVEQTELQEKYDEMSEQFNAAEESAKLVSDRIEAIEDVAEALFEEWHDELHQYTNQSLKEQSEQRLIETKSKYQQLMHTMRRAEDKIQPVLAALRDQVLFLKHNLNAQAINALKGELSSIQGNVSQLVNDMETSIAESEAFIAQLEES